MQTLKIKRIHPTVKLPQYAHDTDAGMDFYLPEDITLTPFERRKVPLGIALELPLKTAGLVWEKSSRGSEGLKTFAGVIDEGYRGELIATLWNTNHEPLSYLANTPIVQLLVQPVYHPDIQEASELTESARGKGAFGSTHAVVDGR